jgi:sugar phosphate isomerase/epimerase
MKSAPRQSRRQALSQAGILIGTALTATAASASAKAAAAVPAAHAAGTGAGAGAANGDGPFAYCLNTGTVRGQKLGIVKEVEVAARAGFQGIEPWVESIEQYAKSGGSLPDLKRRIADLGLTVESAIGFPQWIVDDDAMRAKGLERAKYEMDLVARVGGKRLAAPPAGATDKPGLDLGRASERYRALLEAGDQAGVAPQLELWGFSKNLNQLGACAYVAIETGHPQACVLADVFHLYKGGSPFDGLRLLSASALRVFHINDYPADPPRAKADDSYRCMPGDGVAPLTQILRDLRAGGGRTVLSLELFNRKYWEQDPLEVARLGLAKMKTAAALAAG